MAFYDEHVFALMRQCGVYGSSGSGRYYIERGKGDIAAAFRAGENNTTGFIRAPHKQA